ncbi:sodium/hydrogen exchanger 2-like [Senna tora]|uniref:Sodium/hydrogen exchanger 2-like n=1 Tax=Senna tora TaxID=362788 RepID=A0A834SQ18_9FABA|nr:sodium/hydrogen exchanger 2-like [Senna tora]
MDDLSARTKVAEALTRIVGERQRDTEKRSAILGALMVSGDQTDRGFHSPLLVDGCETTIMTLAFKFLTENPLALAQLKVKKKQFFRNFMEINLYGVVGSMISFFIISLGSIQLLKNLDIGYLELGDYFGKFLPYCSPLFQKKACDCIFVYLVALGAVFLATDLVCTLQVLNQEETPLLYNLVFGEGVVNDATSVNKSSRFFLRKP